MERDVCGLLWGRNLGSGERFIAERGLGVPFLQFQVKETQVVILAFIMPVARSNGSGRLDGGGLFFEGCGVLFPFGEEGGALGAEGF